MPDTFDLTAVDNVTPPVAPYDASPGAQEPIQLPPSSYDAFNKLISDFTEFMTVEAGEADTSLINYTYSPDKVLTIVSPSRLAVRGSLDNTDVPEPPASPINISEAQIAADGLSTEWATAQNSAAAAEYTQATAEYETAVKAIRDSQAADDIRHSSNMSKITRDFARTQTLLIDHSPAVTWDVELELLGDVQFFLGVQHKPNADFYRPAHLYILEIKDIVVVTPTLTRITYINAIQAEPDDIHLIDSRMSRTNPNRVETLQGVLIGRQARIHVAPSDAVQVLEASSRVIRYSKGGLDGLASAYAWSNDRLDEHDKVTMASVSCCIIQVLGAYEAANQRDNVNQFLDKKNDQLEDIIFGLELLITVSMSVQRSGVTKILELLMNIGGIFYNAALMAISTTAFVITKGIILGVLTNIRDRYFKALDDAEKRGADGNRARLAALRCFGLDKMIIKLAADALKFIQKHLQRLLKSTMLRALKKSKALGISDDYTSGDDGGYLQRLQFLTALRDTMWAIKQAVNKGELCFNRGYTDIPRVVEDSGTSSTDELPFYPIDNIELEDIGGQLGIGTGETPGSDSESNDYLNSLFAGNTPGSSNNKVSASEAVDTYSGGILGPTEIETAQFLERYLKLSRPDAIAQVMNNRSTPCREKLSSSQAGYLGSILSQAGLEL